MAIERVSLPVSTELDKADVKGTYRELLPRVRNRLDLISKEWDKYAQNPACNPAFLDYIKASFDKAEAWCAQADNITMNKKAHTMEHKKRMEFTLKPFSSSSPRYTVYELSLIHI